MCIRDRRSGCDKQYLPERRSGSKIGYLPERRSAALRQNYSTTGTLRLAAAVDSIEVAGVTFDNRASAVAKACNYHARAIKHVRHLLPESVVQTLACSLINSRLDYCNWLQYGAPASTINKLQRMQNNATRVVLAAKRHSDAKPLLRQLHWLYGSAFNTGWRF